MSLDHALINMAEQQARLLLSTLEALRTIVPQEAPCPHPKEKIVTVGTMGNTTRICSLCREELLTQEGEAAS
jgi:hypothetical protein